MPSAPRVKKAKATKIAYKILGTPDNIKYKPSKAQNRIDTKLAVENTMRVR